MFWGLEDLLTWAAFTYPVAFFITDITNRTYGDVAARKIVYWGFITAVVLSFYLQLKDCHRIATRFIITIN